MAIDLKELLSAVQSKIGNLTPSSPSRQIEFLAKAAVRSGENLVRSYDSDGEFLDSATTSPYLMLYHTTDKNIYMWDSDGTWKPISGNEALLVGLQGDLAGYAITGRKATNSDIDNIVAFRFASGSETIYNQGLSGVNSLPAGVGMGHGRGTMSETNGYHYGGYNPPSPMSSTMYKFPFSSTGGLSGLSSMSPHGAYAWTAAVSAQGPGYGYYSAGRALPAGASSATHKFQFSNDTSAATPVGTTNFSSYATGQTDVVGGQGHIFQYDIIGGSSRDKYPFASDVNATAITSISISKYGSQGSTGDASNYYQAGGVNPSGSTIYTDIYKMNFTSEGPSTNIGDLTTARYQTGGYSYSGGTAFIAGGSSGTPSPNYLNPLAYTSTIEGISFASDTIGVAAGSGMSGPSPARSGYGCVQV